MNDELPTWERPHLQAGGGDAHLFYKVHGTFDAGLTVSRSKHRCAGVPDGLTLELYDAREHPDIGNFGTDHSVFADALAATGPHVAEAVRTAPRCALLRGIVEQPTTLNYFRDAVGLVQALLESGGVAVFDPFLLAWWTPGRWDQRAFQPADPAPRHHVVILYSDEADGRWYHTRGMLKFGRPDISVRGVQPDQYEAVEDLCNRFVTMQALGAVVPDGQEIRMAGLPSWTCRTVGDLDDPDFNNRHIEIG